MKRIFGLVISFLLLTGCAFNKGVVMPMADGVYTLTGNGTSGFTSLGTVKKRVFKQASKYAKKRNATLEVISVKEINFGWNVLPQVDLSFRLVNESKTID